MSVYIALLALYKHLEFPCLQAWASNETYEAHVEAVAGDDGTVLRAPTEKQGLIPLCKDTFKGTVSCES